MTKELIRSEVGGQLSSPCHCGNTYFASPRLLEYRSFKVLRCTRCGQLRTCPEPKTEALEDIYNQEAAKYTLSNIDNPERRQRWKSIADGILDSIEPFVEQKTRLLDLGCNYGDLLFVARDRGWIAEGLEINAENAQYLQQQGFTVYTDFIEDAGIADNYFDAVVINHVLEHISQPNEFLCQIKRVLKPGGVLFVGVPCFWGAIPLFLKRDDWYAMVPEEHVWQFSVASLRNLLVKHGFVVKKSDRSSSGFYGELTLHPKDMARWMLYKTVALVKQGDMMNVVFKSTK